MVYVLMDGKCFDYGLYFDGWIPAVVIQTPFLNFDLPDFSCYFENSAIDFVHYYWIEAG